MDTIRNSKSVYPDGKATWAFYSNNTLTQAWFEFGRKPTRTAACHWFGRLKLSVKIAIIWKKTKIPSLCPVGEQWYKKCSCHNRQSASRWSSRHKSNTCFCGDQEWHKSNPIREDIPKFDCCQEGFPIHRFDKIPI